MDEPSWWLANAEDRHAEATRSFFIPPREHREHLEVGRLVKLTFEFAPPRDLNGTPRTGERMWVIVAEARPNGTYVGHLDNDPDLLTELKPGDPIEFGPEHVIAMRYSADELGYDPHAFATIDARIVTEDQPPDILIHARPPGTDERIWFASIGPNRPDETRGITLGELTDRWPELTEVFSSNGGGWQRLPDQHAWRQMANPDDVD